MRRNEFTNVGEKKKAGKKFLEALFIRCVLKTRQFFLQTQQYNLTGAVLIRKPSVSLFLWVKSSLGIIYCVYR